MTEEGKQRRSSKDRRDDEERKGEEKRRQARTHDAYVSLDPRYN